MENKWKKYIKAVAILLLFNSMAYYYDRNCHIQKDLRTAREPLECLRSTWAHFGTT